MTTTIRCRTIVKEVGEGEAIVTNQPINFLAMIDSKSGIIKDETHELYGKNISGKVLVFPNAIGSSVGAYSIYALSINGSAPRAMVCSRADITTASGCAIAGIPLVDRAERDIFAVLRTGSKVRVDAKNGRIEIVGS
ncbi:MAG: aconitase X swivel domain-containing protein [Nitrososphaerales archaeon]